MKRKLAVLIVLFMTATLLFAGGGGQQGTAGGVTRLTVQLFDRGTDGGRTQVDNNAWTDWIKAKVLRDLNIDLNFHVVGRWTENTDIINLMASGAAPDLCYTYNGAMVNSFRDQGGMTNLMPMLNLLPDARTLLGDDPVFPGQDFIMRAQTPEGRLYSIYSSRVALAQRNIFIREDWLNALRLPVPTTVAQFEATLLAFRDRAAELPGNPANPVTRNNVIPFMQGSDARWGFANLIHPFITPNLSDADRYVYNVGRNIFYPGYKEGARWVNRMYNQGLIFRDFPLVEGEDGNNTIKSGIAGAYSGNWDHPFRGDMNIIADLRLNVPGANFIAVDAIPSADGITHKDMMDKTGLQVFVPAFSRNAEAALRYLNWLCIPENYQFIQRGQLGVNHEIVNGVPALMVRPPNDPWMQNSTQNIDFTMLQNGIEMGDPVLNARVLALSYGGFSSDVIERAYAVSTTNARAPVVVNVPTTQDGIYGQTVISMADDLLAQAITANPSDFDRIWDAGIQNILRAGAQAIMDERRAIANQYFR